MDLGRVLSTEIGIVYLVGRLFYGLDRGERISVLFLKLKRLSAM